MRTNVLLASCLLIAAAVFPIAAAGDEVVIPLPGEGEGRYVMVLWESGTPGPDGIPIRNITEPDLAAVGGSLLQSKGAERIVDLPLENVAELRQHRSVKYLQRVWMGEPPEEINEAPLSAVGKRKGIATEDGPETWELDYEYDGSGNIKEIGPDNYTYDTAGRLIQATVGGKTEKFKYDPFGNLTELAVDGATPVKVPVDASNRLVGVSYDAAGNVLNSQAANYRYDSLNMLVYADRNGGLSRHYVYDASDELVAMITPDGSSRWTMRDFEGRVLREYSADPHDWSFPWIWKQDFIYGEGHVVGGESVQIPAWENPGVIYGGVRHYHLDHLQSVRMVTDSQSRITARNDYHPFGISATVNIQEAAFLLDFEVDEQRFAGHQRDYLGPYNVEHRDYLDYMHARYYDPNLGRFLSVDPTWESADLGSPQSWNRYAYVRNNPINRIDADGRDDDDVIWQSLMNLLPSLPTAENPIVIDPVNRPLETAANALLIATLVSPFAGDEAVGTAAVASMSRVSRAGAEGLSAPAGSIRVTESVINNAMAGAELKSTQTAVSMPAVQRYVNKTLAGEVAPAIKVDGNLIVDGHHSYVAGRITGVEPARQAATASRSAKAYDWVTEVAKDVVDWFK